MSHTALTVVESPGVESGRGAVTSEREVPVRVRSKELAADGVAVLVLEAIGGETLPEWGPGAHLDLILGGDVATRQYSLCGDPADRSTYRIGVLRDDQGRGSSRHVHDTLRAGDEIVVRGPRNNFQFAAAPSYVFIAGGIGITPILPMLREAAHAGASWTLTYGGRTRASMAFLDELEKHGEHVRIRPQDEFGLLALDALLGDPRPDTLVYCCGPEPLLAAVESACANWPSRSLRVERFNPKPMTEPERKDAFEVVLEQSGQTLLVPPDRSILEVVREAGIAALSACEEGTCGTCEVGMLEGEADHRDSVLDDDEKAQQDCLMICVSRARSPRLVLDL